MLCKIDLKHFKCFENLSLDCNSLNLLCGLNGMGKSSVIQALLALRQSFEIGELSAGRLVLDGELADLGTGLDILFEDAQQDVVGFTLQDKNTAEIFDLKFDIKRASDLKFGYSSAANQLNASEDSLDNLTKCFSSEGWQNVPPFGGRLVYVTAERIGPRKQYPLSTVLARRGDFGMSSTFAWNYLIEHQDRRLDQDDPRYVEDRPRLIDLVNLWLQDVSPGASLHLEPIRKADALIPGFSFDNPEDIPSNRYRATNVGFGLSYVLPVILALLSESGTLCLIENPEAHLHPRGQTKLAELTVRAAKAGVQSFIETHSDHFMDGVRIAVRDGLIAPEEVAFHYFERNGIKAFVSTPKIDRDGRLSQWPSGFFDQHEENLMKLLAPRS